MQKIYKSDPWLEPWKAKIEARHTRILEWKKKLAGDGKLSKAVNNHLYYGLHKDKEGWVFREWAPNATKIYLIGDFNNWKKSEAYALKPVGNGNWELRLPEVFLHHEDLYKLWIEWPGGGGERIPAYVTRAVQDPETKAFAAQVWAPQPYKWKAKAPGKIQTPFIYECHIGMSGEKEQVSSFEDFRRDVLPRVIKLGYNVIQIMALQEHPYYGSFGYQVSNFFALSSRFGTPEEFKRLVDDAHAAGIAVIMDMVHSHSVENELEGLSRFDGRDDLYFYQGEAGHHPAWGSRCFDYGKDEVVYFLLSNCKFWMQEYHLDGFRFDGVTSMMYWDHGLGTAFGNYELYFNAGVDENAVTYLALANMLIHEIDRNAITVAEDVSGMAGLAAPFAAGGVGFDYRMAMGVADHWIKWIKEKSDDDWSMGEMWWELTNKRADEKTVSYAECHDQALVGDKTIIFRLMDKEMYFAMNKGTQNLIVDRGIALHKLIRLVTAATAGNGYLNFMGNEFGHPEWIDFPREGNGWSYKYARRQWSLPDNPLLRYGSLEAFDAQMIHFLASEGVLSASPELITANEGDKVLIFKRKNAIFALNFNPTQSFENYGFEVEDGEYDVVFNSDEVRFDGFGRLSPGEKHLTVDHQLRLYLPSRCAVVLTKK
ncbi:MAG: alpha amylase C-terminal domain-containing protein [Bacteroidales bacterium]|nr:alpha amylase C-terminal domain-containing protein [Bacteroidales bacterium]